MKSEETHDLNDLKSCVELDEAIASASRAIRAMYKSRQAKALALMQGKSESEAYDVSRKVYEREMKRPLMYVVSDGGDD